jgi:hypothetical protein
MKISAAVIALSKMVPIAQAKQPGLSATPGPKQDANAAEVVDKLPPEPSGVRRQPLPVALPDRSAPALHSAKPLA